MKVIHAVFLSFLLLIAGGPFAAANPEAFEIGPDNVDQLPGGKEADGIIGDFLMRNNAVEAVISCDAPLRKANMGTNWNAVTPGCLYDLTFRGENNDQLTIFAPLNQMGPVSYVRVAKDGSDGEAVIEAVVSSAQNGGVYKKHEYIMRDEWLGVFVVTTLKNESQEEKTIPARDGINRFNVVKPYGEITVADSVDPSHKVGYAYGWMASDEFDLEKPEGNVTLKPGESARIGRYFVIGHSPAQAFGIGSLLTTETGILQGSVTTEDDKAIISAQVDIPIGGDLIPAYVDEEGSYNVILPVGEYKIIARDTGRAPVERSVMIEAGETAQADFILNPPSMVRFDIRDEDGKSIPCKAQFNPAEGTARPALGPNNRAHGCLDQYHSEVGKFDVQLPPGKYTVVVTRGIEFSHISEEIELKEGETAEISGTLKRVVDSSGWVSTDFHNHSTPSGDNVTGTYDRLINIAAEQLEFTPTTEHNRLFDWEPYIKELGLQDEIKTVPGMELTGSGAHFNSFPITPVPRTQDGGAPTWNPDPRITAITLRNHQGVMAERWVHLNHPDMVEDFIDRDGDGHADGGFAGLANLIDAAETWGPNTYDHNILTKAPFRIVTDTDGSERVYYQRQFIWLQMLNQGHRYWSIAVADAHAVHGNGVGGWRTYAPSSTDKPAEIDWKEIVRNSKAGQLMVTNGPFLQVETADGELAGGSTRAVGSLPLKVNVQCTDWIDIDRVQVLVNGRQREDLNFTRESHAGWFSNGTVKFDRTIDVPLSQDSHIIVVAYGEGSTLETGYGSSWQSGMNPCAYINPIYVDVDGGGFTPNGDTLDFPLPTRLSVEKAKQLLKRL